jgi:hypothetical protein
LKPIVALLVVATASLFAACSYSGGSSWRTQKEADDAPAKSDPTAGLVAPLRGLGSAVSGKVRVIDRGDGINH